MEITRHQDAAAFLAHAQAPLNSTGRQQPDDQHRYPAEGVPGSIQHPPYLATVEEGERLLAAAVMTPPHRVRLSKARAPTGPAQAAGGRPAPL